MDISKLIDEYSAGPGLLRDAIAGMTQKQIDARPIAGKWSTRQVLCHIADFEIVYVDRMKRVIAEQEPTFFSGDPDTFAAGLAYNSRVLEDELLVIESVRRQMASILRTLGVKDMQRIGNHSDDGPLSLATLLQGITFHLPHHVAFIEEKRKAM
jgi:uncharacterized damage-inducible protein DinB